MNVIAVIPARWGSTRFEGKVLAQIAGKPMIQHVWERVSQCSSITNIIVACDDDRVFQSAIRFGAKVVMTSKNHLTGSDRIVEVIKDMDVDYVINVQGDEPLIDSETIDLLIESLIKDSRAQIATVIKKIGHKEEIDNPNVVKVVVDQDQYALYFSRAAIPFNREKEEVIYYKHIGLYAYSKEGLLTFTQLPQSNLEKAEKLEQLRALEAGIKIKTVQTDAETFGVDTKEDLKRVQQYF